MGLLKVFHVEDGTLANTGRLPPVLKQAALDAYQAASGLGCRFDHNRIEELIDCGRRILSDSANGTGNISHYYRDTDNEAEKLNDLVCRTSGEKHVPMWRPLLRQSEGVHSSQLLGAYALHQIDRAAKYYQADQLKLAFAALALATVATADYGFHWGHADHGDMVSGDGAFNAKKSGRAKGTEAARRQAIDLWRKGPSAGGKWKSKLFFAKQVKDEVMTSAEAGGFRMKTDNAVRTIREWIVAELKKK